MLKKLKCLIKGHQKIKVVKSNMFFDSFEWVSCKRCGKSFSSIKIKQVK